MPIETTDSQSLDRALTLSVREGIQLSPDSPYVFHPRFANPEKTRLRAIVRLPDGRFSEMECQRADTRSPLLRDIFAQYTEDEIEMFTARHNRMVEKTRELEQRVREDKRLADEQEATFQAKAQALRIPEIAREENKHLRRRIRHASNPVEVAALTAIALMHTANTDAGG